MIPARKIRVLHVFGRMDRGGAETWIVNVLKHIDHTRFEFDFLVASEGGAYDQTIRNLGGRVFGAGSPRHLLNYVHNVSRHIRRHGPYDVVHSHVHHFSGVILPIARAHKVPVRIAHSHNDLSRCKGGWSTLPRQAYYRVTERLINKSVTNGFAVSEEAARSLFGSHWNEDSRLSILYCGIDIAAFGVDGDGSKLRQELGLYPDSFVVGHVASFTAQKNHRFLIDVVEQMASRTSGFQVLLVGDGPLKSEIQEAIGKRGLDPLVSMAGLRSDVPQLMTQVMDVFVLPSKHEGLPIVGIEAQAAGLRTLFSENVTREATLVPELVAYLPISSPAYWAEELRLMKEQGRTHGRDIGLRAIEASAFDVRSSTSTLEVIYASARG